MPEPGTDSPVVDPVSQPRRRSCSGVTRFTPTTALGSAATGIGNREQGIEKQSFTPTEILGGVQPEMLGYPDMLVSLPPKFWGVYSDGGKVRDSVFVSLPPKFWGVYSARTVILSVIESSSHSRLPVFCKPAIESGLPDEILKPQVRGRSPTQLATANGCVHPGGFRPGEGRIRNSKLLSFATPPSARPVKLRAYPPEAAKRSRPLALSAKTERPQIVP